MPAVSDKQRRFMAMCSSDEGRKKARKDCPSKKISKKFLHSKLNEEAPANAMGASGSNPASGSVDTFDPMLFNNRKKARKEVERSKMLRRRFAALEPASQK